MAPKSISEPSALVVPFGKHKGTTVAELLARDPQYAEWLLGQGWLSERFAELHAAILSRGAGTDDSPEHNAIQVRFLAPEFRRAFLSLARPVRLAEDRASYLRVQQRQANERVEKLRSDLNDWEHKSWRVRQLEETYGSKEALAVKVAESAAKAAEPIPCFLVSLATFEHRGLDVSLTWTYQETDEPGDLRGFYPIGVEIKPSLGDDYPTVMRQMARLGASVLLIQQYTGRAVGWPDMREMFRANGRVLLTLQEVEANVPR